MPIYIHLATSLLILCMLAGCSASKPDNDNVAATLTNEFGEAIEVGKIEQIDGIAYPGGAGAPESYELEFKATLIAPGPVTLRLSRDLGKQTRVKTIVAGHEPDPVGMAVFLDAMTHLWRTDETRPAVVTGSIRFVKAESGWRAGTMTVFLTDELMQAGSMPPRPRFERVAEGIRDNEQNLIWAQTDNGSGVNWEQAGKYCRSLGSGWNLPTSAQLDSLYDASAPAPSHRQVAWPLTLAGSLIDLNHGLFWSVESVESNGYPHALVVGLFKHSDSNGRVGLFSDPLATDGGKAFLPVDLSVFRALCARGL